MIEPHVHLAYAPRGAGVLYAALWFDEGADVFGWFIGERDGEYRASYFMLQDYYSQRATRLYLSVDDDVQGAWVDCQWGRERRIDACPVPEPLRHELSRLQDQFIRHWLFFRDDPVAQDEVRELNARELAVRQVNIRAVRLGKFHKGAAVWRHDSPHADANVLTYLAQRWPLEHRLAA
jgi:hypothetical protein